MTVDLSKATWYEIPPGATPFRCRGKRCRVDTVYMVAGIGKHGKGMPVDVAVTGGKRPTRTEPGLGVSHFLTCLDANDFSGRKAKGPPSQGDLGL